MHWIASHLAHDSDRGLFVFWGITRAKGRRRNIQTNSEKEHTMSKILSEVLDANAKYSANFGEKGKLAMPPARRFAILTCTDARLDPAKFVGLAEGDNVARIRNHPLIPKSIPVHGYIYDVAQGRLTEVEGARAAGASA
jgi:carbonic anhydrase